MAPLPDSSEGSPSAQPDGTCVCFGGQCALDQQPCCGIDPLTCFRRKNPSAAPAENTPVEKPAPRFFKPSDPGEEPPIDPTRRQAIEESRRKLFGQNPKR